MIIEINGSKKTGLRARVWGPSSRSVGDVCVRSNGVKGRNPVCGVPEMAVPVACVWGPIQRGACMGIGFACGLAHGGSDGGDNGGGSVMVATVLRAKMMRLVRVSKMVVARMVEARILKAKVRVVRVAEARVVRAW